MEYNSQDFTKYSESDADATVALIINQNQIKLGVTFTNCNFSGLNLINFPFGANKFYFCNFSGAIMKDVNFGQTTFQYSNLDYTNLEGAILIQADLQHCSFQSANLKKAKLIQADLQGSDLHGAQLQKANLQGAKLFPRAILSQCGLQGTNLKEANLRGADLTQAELQGAELDEADLRGAFLTQAELQGASLQDAKLQNAKLQRAKLQDAKLQRAKLQRANLQDAKLQRANLRKANLLNANLQGADLEGADLQEANLQGANLRKANLLNANLQGAFLNVAPIVLDIEYDDIGLPNVLSDDLEKAIRMYTYEKNIQGVPWHHVINTKLNNCELLDDQELFILENLRFLFKEVKIKKTVYRGIYRRTTDILLDEMFGDKHGKKLSQFLSTSKDLSVAKGFNQSGYGHYSGNEPNTCCILEITLYPGTKAAYYIKHSHYPNEKEVLIAPGQMFYYDRTYQSPDGMNVIVCHFGVDGSEMLPDYVDSELFNKNNIKVMTYNVSWEALESKNSRTALRRYCINTKKSRIQNKCTEGIVEIIADRAPLDFIFLQEIRLDNPNQYNLFMNTMKESGLGHMYGVGTTLNPPAGIITMYDGTKYKYVESKQGDFLTDATSTGGRGRPYLFTIFQNINNNRIFITINLHAPHRGEVIRRLKLEAVSEPIKQILAEYRQRYPNSMVIIGGDYNERFDNENRNTYRSVFGEQLNGFNEHPATCCDASGEDGQYVDHFDQLAVSQPYYIKYIDVDADYYNKFRLDGRSGGRAFMSDHLPVTAVISDIKIY